MRVGLLIGSFGGGGAERMMINLAIGLSKKNVDVTLYVVNKKGPYLKAVPKNIAIVNYNAKYGIKSIVHKIRRTLKKDNLSVFISTQEHINTIVGLASIGLIKKPKIIFREANTPSKHNKSSLLKIIYNVGYKQADLFVAISDGVKQDMIEFYNISPHNVRVIYNPVINENLQHLVLENPHHPWLLNKSVPVIVGMGRLVPQKDFYTLIKAMKHVQKYMHCRLIIYGASNSDVYMVQLKDYIDYLGLNDVIDLAGFTDNPYAVFNHADAFAQSPIYEGFGNVLVEAMASGCPVVSTDCPSGPREVLDNGKYGKLVKVRDFKGLARAIIKTLENPISKCILKERASNFSVEKSTDDYINLINKSKLSDF